MLGDAIERKFGKFFSKVNKGIDEIVDAEDYAKFGRRSEYMKRILR